MTKNNDQSTTNVSQNKPNLRFTAENAEYAQEKNICVSDCSIKKYTLYPISPRSLRTRRLMKNKANQSQFTPIFEMFQFSALLIYAKTLRAIGWSFFVKNPAAI